MTPSLMSHPSSRSTSWPGVRIGEGPDDGALAGGDAELQRFLHRHGVGNGLPGRAAVLAPADPFEPYGLRRSAHLARCRMNRTLARPCFRLSPTHDAVRLRGPAAGSGTGGLPRTPATAAPAGAPGPG